MGRRLQLTVLGDQGLGKGFGGPLVASPLPSLALWSAVWKSDTVLKPAVAVGLRKPAPLFSVLSLPWVLNVKRLMQLLWETV